MTADNSTIETPGHGDRDGLTPPDRIGPYKILQVLGEGGMGVVYEAEQMEPVRRRVALKVMKAGTDTKQVVARFEAERQALAVMSHPGIAKVLDAGASDAGHPYFVMELVRGLPLTAYCDRRHLRIRERLELFTSVCYAVQHAHQKGVIHRDLKPSNVLVSEEDGTAAPKIIDFGVAKAIGQRLTDRTLVTSHGEAIGTPAYMSPEQAEMTGLDIDTRADIYSLGVMMYELLVGALPVDPLAIGVHTFIAQLVLTDTSPPTPSAKMGTLADRAAHVASVRKTDPKDLKRELRGDLDWIVMKAIDKDRTRRYETANGLALDLERYLSNEPVLARRPSATYRMKKFVRRHRAPVVFAGFAVLTLAAFGITMALQAKRIAMERDRAERETLKALAVNDFMSNVLMAAEPLDGLGPDATVLDALDWIVAEHAEGFSEDPEVDANVRHAVGNVYTRLGRLGEAEPLIQRSYETRLTRLGPDHPDVAESLYELAELRVARGELDSAAVLLQQCLAIRRAALNPTDVRFAFVLNRLGWVQVNRGNLEAAESLLVEALTVFRAQERETVSVSEALDVLGQLYRHRGEPEKAEAHIREALALRERFYPSNHTKIGESLNNLAVVLDDAGQKDEAAELYRRAISIQEAIYGTESDIVAAALSNLGLVLTDVGQAEEGETVHRRALAITEGVSGPDGFNAAIQRNNLARHLCTFEKSDEGLIHSRAAVRIGDDVFEEGFFVTGVFRSTHGFCLGQSGQFASAESMLLEAVAILEAALGPDHTHAATARNRLADLYDDWGKPDMATEIRAR